MQSKTDDTLDYFRPAAQAIAALQNYPAPAQPATQSRCREVTPPIDLAREYERLIQKCVALEPNGGYIGEKQLPALNGIELAAILAHDPDVLPGVATSISLQADLVATLTSAHKVIDQAALIGVAVISALTVDCRKYILDAVQEEIARDEDRRRLAEDDTRRDCEGSAAARMEWLV